MSKAIFFYDISGELRYYDDGTNPPELQYYTVGVTYHKSYQAPIQTYESSIMGGNYNPSTGGYSYMGEVGESIGSYASEVIGFMQAWDMANVSSNFLNASLGATAVGELLSGSSATFRLTNNKGALSIRFYQSGWRGNQWVATARLSSVGSKLNAAGIALSTLSLGVDAYQFSNGTMSGQRLGYRAASWGIGTYIGSMISGSLGAGHLSTGINHLLDGDN